MAAQLTCDPIIKITLTSNEVFDEVAPGYVYDYFRLTKGLLKPNKFEFVIRKEELTVEPEDIDFELRKKLLAAMVEVKLQARYYDAEEDDMKEYEVENFFYGYIQNIKIVRLNGKPVTFRCTAYSPDAKMKHSIANNTYIDFSLTSVVAAVTSYNASEKMTHFDKKEGTYSEKNNALVTEIHPASEASQSNTMPYTVQYKESPFNFLKRLARRYAEFMYYENHAFYFGEMKLLDEIHLHNGADLVDYTYEMNMNDHNGIMFVKNDQYRGVVRTHGFQKRASSNQSAKQYESIVDSDEYENEMAKSAYETASDYFGDEVNSFVEFGAQPLVDRNIMELEDGDELKAWYIFQHRYLDRYVMSDSLICTGKADRVDLKLGSVIVIEDQTKIGEEKKEEWKEHKPLKVIELAYVWNKEKDNLGVRNWFKAIPKEAKVPPYLERDKDGFLVYGDFDLYPKCGPQYGKVVDNYDPAHMGRVRVSLTWQEAYGRILNYDTAKENDVLNETYNLTPWIWVVSPYQGWDHGAMAVPEVGDMVLVGFEHNNAERPYVIGSRYSEMRPMNKEWTRFEKNRVKGFRSRSGHTVEIIDKEGDLKDGKDFQKGGRIHIYDAKTHAYDILFDTDQKLIRMVSKGNIELQAGNDIIMNADNNISLHAKNDYHLNADNNGKVLVNNDMNEWTGNNKTSRVGNEYKQLSSNNTSIEAGADMYLDSNKDMYLHVRGDASLRYDHECFKVVDEKATTIVKKDLLVSTEGEGSLEVSKKLYVNADEIVEISQKDFSEYSNNHNIKAQNSIKINATTSIDLKALKIKEN